MPGEKRLMTARKTAAYLGVKVSTLAKWRCYGGGPEFTMISRRRVMYDAVAVDAWIDSRTLRLTSNRTAAA